MSTSIGKLAATAVLDARGFQAGTQAVLASAKGMESKLEKIFGNMGASIGFGGGFRLGFENVTTAIPIQLGRQFLQNFTATVDENLELGFLSDRLGADVSWVSSLQTVASEMSINAEQMSTALDRLNQTIGQARLGSTEARTTFTQLGLEWESISNQRFDQAFSSIAEALSRVENRSERARLSTELFGRGAGQRVLRLMEGGADGLARALADVQSRGGFIDSAGLARLQAADDAMDRMTTQLSSTWRNFVVATAPAVTSAFSEINRIVDGIKAGWQAITANPIANIEAARREFQAISTAQRFITPSPPGSPSAGMFPISSFDAFQPQPATEMTGAEQEQAIAAARVQVESARAEVAERLREAELALTAHENPNPYATTDEVDRAFEVLQDAEARLANSRRRQAEAAAALSIAEQGLAAARDRDQLAFEDEITSFFIDLGATEIERQADALRRAGEAAMASMRLQEESFTPLDRLQMRLRQIAADDSLLTGQRASLVGQALRSAVGTVGASPLLGSLSAGSTEVGSILQAAMGPQRDQQADMMAQLEAMLEIEREQREFGERQADRLDEILAFLESANES